MRILRANIEGLESMSALRAPGPSAAQAPARHAEAVRGAAAVCAHPQFAAGGRQVLRRTGRRGERSGHAGIHLSAKADSIETAKVVAAVLNATRRETGTSPEAVTQQGAHVEQAVIGPARGQGALHRQRAVERIHRKRDLVG